jgi:hypothetical protein
MQEGRTGAIRHILMVGRGLSLAFQNEHLRIGGHEKKLHHNRAPSCERNGPGGSFRVSAISK